MIAARAPARRVGFKFSRVAIALLLSGGGAIVAPLTAGSASTLGAQERTAFSATSGAVAARAADDPTSSPLERRIVLRLRDVSLREALDRVAAVARLRLSYSAELLPLDRSVRAVFDSTTVGDALGELLKGVSVTPVVAGPDQVVLAPSRVIAREKVVAPAPRAAVALERVVVTGSAAGASQRSLTVALDVVSGRQMAREGVTSLSSALDGSVPGLWVWGQGAGSLLSHYGSVRGASSFGATYPKVYIDGIEVANPLVVTQMDAQNLERVEVIRGPQGAALYGSDAISGVVNFVTRHEGVDGGAPRLQVHSTGGLSESQFATNALLAQDHSAAFNMGSATRSANANVAFGTLGAVYQGASQQYARFNAGGRWVGTNSVWTATARLASARIGASVNPLLADSTSATPNASSVTAPQSITQLTVGATAKFMANERWTNTLVAGVDAYQLSNVGNELTPFPSGADSALRAASGKAQRGTLRASTVGHFALGEAAGATLTFSAEHSALREGTPGVVTPITGGPARAPIHRGGVPTGPATTIDWITATGLVSQADLSLHDKYFLTGGVRLERSDAYVGTSRYTTLPMLGGAVVQDFGDISLKFRAAFGRGIRAPRTATRETVAGGLRAQASLVELSPEEQSGIEYGIDLYITNALSLQLTRFDQVADGLIQQVPVRDPNAQQGKPGARLAFEYQNVGAISNRGWEMQGTLRRGPFSLRSAVALVDSRVKQLARGYGGDLRRDDRVLGVPASTASVAASYTNATWSATVGLTRAYDWVEYDRVSLTQAYAKFDRQSVPLLGADLRGYWQRYNGIDHLRASLSHTFGRGLTFTVAGENLLNRQRGEPDNITIIAGRTITTGLKASFY